MRKTRTIAAFVVIAVLGLINWSLVSSAADKVGDRLLLYVRVARLYTREPDLQLQMPVQNVSRNSIRDTWHAARDNHRRHEGQDIFAPRGTPVTSATNGYVINIGENQLGGLTVSVAGAGGRVYYYAHLDSYAPNLTEGDRVTPNTVLGFVGTTGNAQGTPPHLHFGVYAMNGAINPLPLLADRSVETKPTEPQKNKNNRRQRLQGSVHGSRG